MPNAHNLKNIDSHSPEKAKEIRSKGGKARAEKVRERKMLKEEILAMLEVVQSNGKTIQQNGVVALGKNMLKGDIATWNYITAMIGEKPAEKIEVSGNVSQVANDIGEFVDANTTTKKHD